MSNELRSGQNATLGADELADLLQRTRERDALAFEHLYDAYHPLAYGIALHLLSDVAVAEDLTQAVFLKFWNHPESFPGGDFPAWISRVTRIRALDLIENTVAHPGPTQPLEQTQSTRMKSRIFEAMRSQAETPRSIPVDPAVAASERTRQFAYAIAAGAILLALLTTMRDISLQNRLINAEERVSLLHLHVGEGARASAQRNTLIADLFSGKSKHYAVLGGQIVVHADHLYLVMRKLPKLPPGHVFQAWIRTLGSAEQQPTLTFTPDHRGMAILQLPIDAGRIAALSVSIEPEGGSKTPTTRPLFDERLH